MFNGPQLVIKSTILTSLLIAITCLWATAPVARANSLAATSPSQGSPGAEVNSSQPTQGHEDDIVEACRVNTGFPDSILQWCSTITRHAEQNDLSPDLIAALILQESGGDHLAFSHSGAVGLMQVMPRDGIAAGFMCVNGPCFASRPTIQELQDPEFNISYGTRFLASLLSRHGNIRDALKSYGPMDVGYGYADKVLAIYDRYH